MEQVIINNISYEKLIPIMVYKYEFLLLIKNGCVYYALENNETYEILDKISFEDTNLPVPYIKSRLLMEHIKDILNLNINNDSETIYDLIFKMQDILQYPEICNMIKNNDIDSKIISIFDDYFKKINESVVKRKNKEVTKNKSQGNTDIFMVIIITNIGILLFLMFILNLIK